VIDRDVTIEAIPEGDWLHLVVVLEDGSYKHVGRVSIDWDVDQIEDYVDDWLDSEYPL